MEPMIRRCTLDDLPDLLSLAYRTFDETFRPFNTTENIESYLNEAFNEPRFRAELANPKSAFFFLYKADALAGYLKLNEPGAQTDESQPDALEIERIYVAKEFQGQGLGRVLMEYALAEARHLGFRQVWLGVWEKNVNAIAFYEKMGFAVAGQHTFWLGNDRQTDFILRRAVAGEAR